MSERYVYFKKRKWKSIRVVGLNRIDIMIDGCSIDVHYENLSVENEDIHRCVFCNSFWSKGRMNFLIRST